MQPVLNIVSFIKSNADWRAILSGPPYNLTINDGGGFIMLKYSQIDSDFTIDLVRECRGIILDNEYNAVCVPFFKFANFGEAYADEIDWATARVEEKVDGSLIKVWNYNEEWIISTNGTIFADNAPIGSQYDDRTDARFDNFGDLFRVAADNAGLDITALDPQCTYMFELCSPYNRIVVPHEEIKIYHIGTRNNSTCCEMEIDIGVAKPGTFVCSNLSDLIGMASKLRYCEEGYVVRDGSYNRIKVKSPAYVAVHHLISDMSDKRLLELIRNNETEEFLTYFPEYRQYIEDLTDRLLKFEEHINAVLHEQILGHQFESRKDFAAVVTKTQFPDFFFRHYDKKIDTPLQWLWSFPNDKVLQFLDKLSL